MTSDGMTQDFDIQAGGPGLTIEQVIERYGLFVKRGPSLIVIGPDGVGKTTIARHISRELRVPMFKCPSEKTIFVHGGRESLTFDHMLTYFLEQTGYRFISDRGYPCEWVYSKVFGRKSNPYLIEEIDARHAGLGTKILYLYSSERPYEEDEIVPMDRYEEIRAAYDLFSSRSKCEVTSFDMAGSLRNFHIHDFDGSEGLANTIIDTMGIR